MNRKPKSKSAKKTLSSKSMKAVKGGALNAYFSSVQGEKQGKFKEATGLKTEVDVID
jgi:hypothetical protein